jgi:hypothetical protein
MVGECTHGDRSRTHRRYDPAMDGDLAILAAILAAGFFVEAVAGFGGTVLVVSIGATRFSIAHVLAVFLPLNLALSGYLALRHRRVVAGRYLVARVLPAMAVGMAGGTALALTVAADRAKLAFAILVVAVALRELIRLAHRGDAAAPPPAGATQLVVLTLAGVIHGWFATGGPLVVAIASRALPAKDTMRATLAVLWFALNTVVVARLATNGDLDGATLTTSAAIVPALIVAIALGEWVHHRTSQTAFRCVVATLLLAIGTVLAIRQLA